MKAPREVRNGPVGELRWYLGRASVKYWHAIVFLAYDGEKLTEIDQSVRLIADVFNLTSARVLQDVEAVRRK